MENKLILIAFVLLFGACNSSSDQTGKEANDVGINNNEMSETNEVAAFGNPLDEGAPFQIAELQNLMEDVGTFKGNITGTITSTCAKKGCWMTMANGEGKDMRVTFKDYGFFVPTEGQEGKTAILSGEAVFDTLSVELLRHYAEDAKKSQAEIDAITEPEFAVAFIATGVEIK